MKEKELEKVRKSIHGKIVKFKVHGKDKLIISILLWEKDGKKVSVKPYGQKPETLKKYLRGSDQDVSLKELKNPKYCFATHPTSAGWKGWDTSLRRLAKLPEKSVYDFYKICGRKRGFNGSPVCPY
jgi:hypothetical protein